MISSLSVVAASMSFFISGYSNDSVKHSALCGKYPIRSFKLNFIRVKSEGLTVLRSSVRDSIRLRASYGLAIRLRKPYEQRSGACTYARSRASVCSSDGLQAQMCEQASIMSITSWTSLRAKMPSASYKLAFVHHLISSASVLSWSKLISA